MVPKAGTLHIFLAIIMLTAAMDKTNIELKNPSVRLFSMVPLTFPIHFLQSSLTVPEANLFGKDLSEQLSCVTRWNTSNVELYHTVGPQSSTPASNFFTRREGHLRLAVGGLRLSCV